MHWYSLAVNPEQWAVGPLNLGRKNGRVFATMGRNQGLFAYQEAVREEITSIYSPVLIEGPVRMVAYFWRKRSEYEHDGRRVRKHQVDGTNLYKALEDALQGILYDNDKDAVRGEWVIMDQGFDTSPGIIISIEADTQSPPRGHFPAEVYDLRKEHLVTDALATGSSGEGNMRLNWGDDSDSPI